MARRKELLDITHGISGSFNSRNNDFNGYWALGVLYKLTNEINRDQLELDLLKCRSNPDLAIVQPVIRQYHSFLSKLLTIRKINNQWIKQAIIIICFNQYHTTHHKETISLPGDPYISICKIRDDMEKTYQSIYYGKCWLHDPKREHRSLRETTELIRNY